MGPTWSACCEVTGKPVREATGRPAVRVRGDGRVEIISMSVAGILHVPKATKSSHQLRTVQVIMGIPCNLQGMVDTGKFSSVSDFPVLYMRCHFFYK